MHNEKEFIDEKKEPDIISNPTKLSSVYTTMMITQQVRYFPKNINSTIDFASKIREALAQLKDESISSVNVWAIRHDDCWLRVWDPSKSAFVMEQKEPHDHVVVRCSKRHTLNQYIDALRDIVPAQAIEPPKSKGKYSLVRMLGYLVHATDSTKTQYSPDRVISLVNDPKMSNYSIIYNHAKAFFDKQKAFNTIYHSEYTLEEVIQKIKFGEIYEREQIFVTKEFFDVYTASKSNATEIDNVFNATGMRRAYLTAERIKKGELLKSVIFVTGEAGVGKGEYVIGLLNKLRSWYSQRGINMTVCSCPSGNPPDDYNGEHVIMLDDGRGCFLNATEWLHLIDPIHIYPASARYKNKDYIAPEVIIIDSHYNPYEFFSHIRGNGDSGSNENLDQFIRRIMALVHIIKYDDETRGYCISYSGQQNSIVKISGKKGTQTAKSSYDFIELYKEISRDEAIDVICNDIINQRKASTTNSSGQFEDVSGDIHNSL